MAYKAQVTFSDFAALSKTEQRKHLKRLFRSLTFKRKEPMIHLIDLFHIYMNDHSDTHWRVCKFDMSLTQLKDKIHYSAIEDMVMV